MSEQACSIHTLLYNGVQVEATGTAAVELPPVPITLATHLRLEKLVMRSAVMDLRAITEAILLDPGATLQLLRIAGQEFCEDEYRPTRIEHCIVSLDRERWYLPVCAWIVTGRHAEVTAAWQQFSLFAYAARQVAMRLSGFPPEEAYLVGLLHQLGSLPQLLGWTNGSMPSNHEEDEIGLKLAQLWRMPRCVIDALREQHEGTIGSRWNFLLRLARRENPDCLPMRRAPMAVHPAVQHAERVPALWPALVPRQSNMIRE